MADPNVVDSSAPDPVDPDVIRTIIGEVKPGDVEGAKAVAQVLSNRRYMSGAPYTALITDPNQFEARTGAAWPKLQNIPPTDSNYQQIAAAVTPILQAKGQPAKAYTHYYSPNGQVAQGRPPPSFDDGTGVDIGGNRFFSAPDKYSRPGNQYIPPSTIDSARKEGYTDDQIASWLSGPTSKYNSIIKSATNAGYSLSDVYKHLGLKPSSSNPGENIVGGMGQVLTGVDLPEGKQLSKDEINQLILSDRFHGFNAGPNGEMTTDAQNETIRRLAKAGVFDMTHFNAYKDIARPYLMKTDQDPIDPSMYAIRPNGDLITPKGKEPSTSDKVATGVNLALHDVARSLNDLTAPVSPNNRALMPGVTGPISPGATSAELEKERTALEASPAALTREARAARFGTQAAITTPPLIAGGEAETAAAAAAKGVPYLGPALRFISGTTPKIAEGSNLAPTITNALVRAGSKSAAGAQLGAAGSALLGEDPVKGAAGGAIIPAAGDLAAGAADRLVATAGGIMDPFTTSGQNRIINRYLTKVTSGGPTEINSQELIPGVKPTLAQSVVGGNAGLSATERALRNTPGAPNNLISARDAENAAARVTSYGSVAGTPETVEALEDQRDATTAPMREKAFYKTGQNSLKLPGELVPVGPSDSRPVVQTIDQILASPVGQRTTVTNALHDIRDKLVSTDINGRQVYETNPAQLYGVRQHIGDLQSTASESGRVVKQLASKELSTITSVLDNSIEGGAPGFKDYLNTHSDMSKPIDQQKFLQSLGFDKPEDFKPAAVDRAIEKAEAQRALPGAKDAKSLTDDQMSYLYKLQKDVARDRLSMYGTKNVGSTTVQNLATGNFMDQLGIPSAAVAALAAKNPILGGALAGVRFLHGSQNPAIAERLTHIMLNPMSDEAHAAIHSPDTGLIRNILQNKLVGDFSKYGVLPATIEANNKNVTQSP